MNNNDQVVFFGLDSFGTVLATPDILFNKLYLDTPLRPMIADDGRVIVRAGPNPTDPINLYNIDLSLSATISTGFNEVGQSPGISDDGTVVAFVGNRGSGTGGLHPRGETRN